MRWFMDSFPIFSVPLAPGFWDQEGPSKVPCDSPIPFDKQFQTIFNLAVGGSFFGDDPSITPEEAKNWPSPKLVVDWFRIYQPFILKNSVQE